MSSIIAMTNAEWEQQKAEYRRRLNELYIPIDIHPRTAFNLLSSIDMFFSEIRLDLSEIEGYKERIDSIIRELERQHAVGNNESTRKKNATLAVQNFTLDNNQTTNLYEVQRVINERLSFIQGVVDILNAKQARLITITGILKIEQNLFPYSMGGNNVTQLGRELSYGAAQLG